MDDALVGGLVDPLHGDTGRHLGVFGTGLGGDERPLDPGTQLGTHGLVGKATLLVLAVALDLALNVGHGVAGSMQVRLKAVET